ncbi:MAG TPA: ATP-binding protein [Dongiaceae bacterium]|nr:ATP-binding protein [Dongiaceae bacterium]
MGFLLIVLAAGAFIYNERQRQLADAATEAATRDYFLADQAARLFEVSKIGLSAASNLLGEAAWDDLAKSADLQHQLRRLADALPYIEDVWFNDDKGLLRLTSFDFPTPYSNAADRDSFKAAQQAGDRLFIGSLIVGRVTKRPTFLISRRMEWPDHQLRGMVSVTADIGYFVDYWQKLQLPYDERITLFRRDNLNILAQYPPTADSPPQQDLYMREMFSVPLRQKSAGGSYSGDRFGTFRQVGDLPLYLSVDISRDAVTAAWWNWVWSRLPIALLAAFSFLVVTILALRQAAIEAADKAALEEARTALSKANVELRAEIDQREKAEGQIRQMQKLDAIGQLTGGLAHDFNNMLSIVIGSLSMMKRRMARGEFDIERYIDTALEGAQRAATLTQRLLAFARQQPLAPQTIDANRFVSGMSDLLRRTLTEAVQVETVLAGGLWKTRADPSQLESAVLNLAVNARDAMPNGGRLTIETANASLGDEYSRRHGEIPSGQYVLIAVTDTGSGMPPEIAAKAFEPFFTTKQTGRGTGLGLSQVYGFVRQSGGHVKIYSELGQGTTVKIYLPRFYGVSEEGEVSVATTIAAFGGAATEVILVVEDEETVRQLSVDALTELGYTVVQADGADSALKVVNERADISLLFTDIVMPGRNGRQLADEVAKIRPELKVLFTTGYTRNAVVHNGILDAGVRMLGKPFSVEQLARSIREALDGK